MASRNVSRSSLKTAIPDPGSNSGRERNGGSVVVALATPLGRSALAVVRLTGHPLIGVVRRVFPRLPDPVPSRKPLLATAVDRLGSSIDQGLLTYFPAPHSYTGEDVAEFSGHGNPRLVVSAKPVPSRPSLASSPFVLS